MAMRSYVMKVCLLGVYEASSKLSFFLLAPLGPADPAQTPWVVLIGCLAITGLSTQKAYHAFKYSLAMSVLLFLQISMSPLRLSTRSAYI
jgi:hypothetical protein